MEKYQKRGDIFDAKFYSEQLNRDILKIINHIENQLMKNLTELKNISIKLGNQNYESANIQANRDEQKLRITLLMNAICSML